MSSQVFSLQKLNTRKKVLKYHEHNTTLCFDLNRGTVIRQSYPVQLSSGAQSCPTLCDPMNRSTPGLPGVSITNSRSLLKLTSIKSVMPSNHLDLCSHYLILCCPLLLLPSIFPSIRVFSNELALHIRWPKYWSFSFSVSPSNEYLGLISFRTDWWDLRAVQGTLKSFLQHYSSKPSILRRSAFFISQLTSIHDYRKNHSLG